MVILVHGSINIDQFLAVTNIAAPGQTIHSSDFYERAGGKGANSAVAIAKAGQQVNFAGTIGKDGLWLQKTLSDYGVSIETLVVDDKLPTGKAFIQVADNGENAIVLVTGANGLLYGNHLDRSLDNHSHPGCNIDDYSHVLLQNEISFVATSSTIALAKKRKIPTIWNPSPMLSRSQIDEVDWESIDYLVLNEREAEELLSGMQKSRNEIDAPLVDLYQFRQAGLRTTTVIMTKGRKGAQALLRDDIVDFPLRVKVDVQNTTGAGDCFVGYFSALLAEMRTVESSVEIALVAASMSCESPGAMDSYPSMPQVRERMRAAGVEA